MTSLVVVESPAKAKTLSRFLGPDYRVEASYGHIRDLPGKAQQIPAKYKGEPWARLGVNVDQDFDPIYVLSADRKANITNLKKALAGADELILATDEDREGESIGWHILEVLKPKVPVKRIAFHEITEEAIHEALAHPRELDYDLVRAQENRRIIDRLYGYELSPLLWKKVAPKLSAGRVQSVAVRLCVLRERERRRFKSAGYWSLEAALEKDGIEFTARLRQVGDARVADGRDFDADTGQLKSDSDRLWIRSREQAEEQAAGWRAPWRVAEVETKPVSRRPAAPFTTSSMQQSANRRLGFSASRTMRAAQRLYEGIDLGNGDREGLITYMRTDSTTLSQRALAEAQQVIREQFGGDYADGPRTYKTKSKGAQEAHEAIRPTHLANTPDKVRGVLSQDEARLYELIWRRTMASQMPDARLLRTTADIHPRTADGGEPATFRATGQSVDFPGWMQAWGRASGDDDEALLPSLAADEQLEPVGVEPVGKETKPPARFTEASLVKTLEELGIGRPSTYAPILETIQRREYVEKQGNALVPTFTAHAVTDLLEKHFRDYVDTDFTAHMEQSLDDVANGDIEWLDHLQHFYFGDGDDPGLRRRLETETEKINYPAMYVGEDPEGREIVVRIGRSGPFLQRGEGDDKQTASVPEGVAPADLSLELAIELLEAGGDGPRPLGTDEDGETIYLATGRYGPYVQVGETPEKGSKAPKPKRASVAKGVEFEDVTLDDALLWLSLPRTLGEHPETGEPVEAKTGRYGHYLQCGKETRTLPDEDDIYTVGLDRALEILAQPKTRGRRGPKVLKEFGEDKGLEVKLLDGRYGPYLTNGEVNASLRKGEDPEKMTREQALDILGERGKAPKRRSRKKK